VVQAPLNLELTFHLAEEVKLLKHVLVNDFECDGDARAAFNCAEDFAKFATANALYAAEVAGGPLLL